MEFQIINAELMVALSELVQLNRGYSYFLVSRITNDMLLGAIATSTGLWVIGIMVTVSYVVITA
jgi:hypothetical protein